MLAAEIPLTRGLTALVDQVDYDRLSTYSWQAVKGHNGVYYARRTDSQFGSIYMHQAVFGFVPSGFQIDHIDNNGLNNRQANLRLSDYSKQQHNTTKRKNKSSRFKGVYLSKNGKWIATIYINCNKFYLGSFSEEKDAALKYNAKAIEFYGEHARLNSVT